MIVLPDISYRDGLNSLLESRGIPTTEEVLPRLPSSSELLFGGFGSRNPYLDIDPYNQVDHSPTPAINSPEAASEARSVLDDVEPTPSTERADYSDLIDSWFNQLFETSEKAALLQAERNERSAVAAYHRSEQAADNALKRARALRQTAYQDAVQSLKAAGLNPVLAAGGGISGSSTTAPQANAPSSSSSMAAGLNAADLLTAFAALLSSAGNIMKGVSSFLPSQVISTLLKG